MNVRLDDLSIGVQRIFCVGRNYAAHAAELGNAAPVEPVIFMKPPTAIVPHDKTILLPRDRGAVHFETEIVLLVGRDGASSTRDIAGIALGLDLTLRDEQAKLKAQGLPWELAKAFDGSAPLGDFATPREDFNAVEFTCRLNGEQRQHGRMRDMLFPVPRIVEFLASRFTLRKGDLVFTGTPQGVGPLVPGDVIELESASVKTARWQCA
ncbi:MAG TPA: fumarylacetoacetate hydrolase family protein [Gammaproteobacteria bacterium]